MYTGYTVEAHFDFQDEEPTENVNDETLNDIQDYLEYELSKIIGVSHIRIKVIS